MKRVLLSTALVASAFATTPTIADLQKQINELKAQQDKQNQRYFKKVAPISANDHIYWSVDFRTSFDYLYGKDKKGKKYANNIFANRLILGGMAQPSSNLKFNFKLSVNSLYGMQQTAQTSPYNNISWTADQTPDDTNMRLKEAYFNWFFDDGKMMLSTGRRPSTNGYPANLREDDNAESPVAHLVNMEFDGISFWIKNDKFADWSDKFSDWGTNLKFCAGRGYSSTVGANSQKSAMPYGKNDLSITDFAGFLLVPYDDGQYSVWSENIYAWNMKGYNNSNNLKDLGNYVGSNWIFKADGVGDGISDYLDDTKAFASVAFTETMPYAGRTMQGSKDKKVGGSIWIGADMPAGEEGRWGVNLIEGSKYYRAMTYGEDTLVGSIAAVRGTAYDVYYTAPIMDNLSYSIRATYLDYKYAGSNGFFGDTSNPNQSNYLDSATDIRAYIRYRF